MSHCKSLLPFAGALALVAGCVENDQAASITANYTLSAPSSTGDGLCTPGTTLGPARGMLDVTLAAAQKQGYILVPKVVNNLPSNMSLVNGMTMGTTQTGSELNNLYLLGFDINIIPDPDQNIDTVLQAGVNGLTSFFVAEAGGQLMPMGGSVTIGVEIVPAALADLVANLVPGPTSPTPYPTLTVNVQARLLHDGSELDSQTFAFPVQLCAGCLQQNPNTSMGGPNDIASCPDGFTGQQLCTPTQDTPVQCCYDMTRVLQCDAVGSMMSSSSSG